jgi:hypothetical protein
VNLKTKLYLQKKNLAYCSLNSVRTVCDYYLKKKPSRSFLLKNLKTGRRSGTFQQDIYDTLGLFFKIRSRKRLTENSIISNINQDRLIVISYKSGIREYHTSIISGFTRKKGILYTTLTDSWLGYYDIPFSILKVLVECDQDPNIIIIQGLRSD